MTTPENNPQGNPPISFNADNAEIRLAMMKQDTESMTIEKIVNLVKNETANATELEQENVRRVEEGIPEGMPFDNDPSKPDSKDAKAASVKFAVQTLLLATTTNPPKEFTPEGLGVDRLKLSEATELTKIVLESIIQEVGIGNITADTAPYFQKLFVALLTGQIVTIQDLQRKYDSISSALASVSPDTYRRFRSAMIRSAIKKAKLKDTEANQLFKDVSGMEDSLRKLRKSPDFNNAKIMETIERDLFAKDKLELGKFYAAMENAQTFETYYDTLYQNNITEDKLKEIEKVINNRRKNMPPDELRREAILQAKENTAKEIHQKLIYLVNLFYKPVLVAAPDQQFRQALADYGGPYSPNPDNMFRQLTSRISSIATSQIGGSSKGKEKIFMAFTQEEDETIIPEQRTTLFTRTPIKEYKECGFERFIEQMRTIADTERNTMEFGHNFRFATNKGPQGDKGFFETIGQFIKEGGFSTSDIDVITSVEYADLVQIAKIQLERRYKLAFSKLRWQRDIKLMRQVFESTNAIDRDIRASFMRDFAGTDQGKGKYPEIIIDRCLSHARTLVYAKEFSLQLWASYSDPRLEKGGKPTYSREELAGASSFNPVDDAIRWGDINDLNNNGELYLPTNGKTREIRDHDAAVAKGRKEFHESFTFGHAAFESEDEAPTIAIIGNDLTRGGGMDSIGGYRVRQAYDQWLTGIMDERTNNREINVRDSKEDVMVEAWKRVENIGVNILRNYTDDMMLTESHRNALERENDSKFKGEKSVTKKYQALFGFWYDRYLGDKDSVGNVYVEGKSKQQYVNEMMENIKIITDPHADKKKKEDAQGAYDTGKYNVLSVILFERSPLEFISMEKPRMTQNGVTLMSQIQNSFVEDMEIKNRKLDPAKEFDAATNDLVFIEQKARMDSIQQMDEIRKTNKLNGDEYNLYGEKNKNRSLVMQMDGWAKNEKGGYVIDETYIENVLKEQYKNDSEADRNWKIKRAKKMYAKIKNDMKKRPDHNSEIDIFLAEGKDMDEKRRNTEIMRKKLEAMEKDPKRMKNRMDWWADAWKEYKFGMTFHADTADQFMDRTRTGPDTLAQAADFNANAAEVMKKHFLVDMKKACKQAAMAKDFKPLYDYLGEIKGPIEGQDGALADKMVKLMIKRIINTMRKDDKAMKIGGDLYDTMSGRAGSISETYTGEENFNRVWSWDRNDIKDFLDGAHGQSGGKVLAELSDKKELQRYGHAKFSDIFRHHLLPIAGLGTIALLAYVAYHASKEDK